MMTFAAFLFTGTPWSSLALSKWLSRFFRRCATVTTIMCTVVHRPTRNLIWPLWAQKTACSWGIWTGCSMCNLHSTATRSWEFCRWCSVQYSQTHSSAGFLPEYCLANSCFAFLWFISPFTVFWGARAGEASSHLPQLNYWCSQILLTWMGFCSPRGTQFSKNCKWVDADRVVSQRNIRQIWIHTKLFQSPKRKHCIKQSITQAGLSSYSDLRYGRSQASQQYPFHFLSNIQMVLAVLRAKCLLTSGAWSSTLVALVVKVAWVKLGKELF